MSMAHIATQNYKNPQPLSCHPVAILESEGRVADGTMLNSVACTAICGHDTIDLNCFCLG